VLKYVFVRKSSEFLREVEIEILAIDGSPQLASGCRAVFLAYAGPVRATTAACKVFGSLPTSF
jgi:hypothetical protein